MDGRYSVLFLFLLGLTWSCHGRNPIFDEPFAHENQEVCELCDKYLTLGIEYLQDEDKQNAIAEALHMSCSQIPPLKKECLSVVDHYTQLLFTQVSLIKPRQICRKLNLCRQAKVPQGSCEACRQSVSEVITKMKDPETKLKIIRLLRKECKSLNNVTYQDKCKKMVIEYGPLVLADLDKFLEKKDVCSILGVCPTPAIHRDYIPAVEAVADS